MRTITMADWKVSRYHKKHIKKVLKSGRLTYGPYTKEFEERFAELHGRKHALFTNSGTAALKIALGALKERHKWKDGDEVIIPSVTFIATMNVVLMNNLKPVLVDVKRDNANINPELIEKAITKKTRAILPVHLLGQSSEMKEIMKIAKKHNLKVVEDSCETMFVYQDGKPVGSQGDVACFSSYVAHLLTTGVGGLITTNDTKLATIMRSMMFHGRDESYLNIDDISPALKKFYFPRFGYSDRLTEMEAVLGLGDLQNWQEMIFKRQENAAYIVRGLTNVISVIGYPITNFAEHAFMFFPLYVLDRDRMIEHLEANGIQTRTMMPLTIQPTVRKYVHKKYPEADFVNKHGLLIGCHQYLNKEDLNYIIKTIEEFV